jgi:hypothetical protein
MSEQQPRHWMMVEVRCYDAESKAVIGAELLWIQVADCSESVCALAVKFPRVLIFEDPIGVVKRMQLWGWGSSWTEFRWSRSGTTR